MTNVANVCRCFRQHEEQWLQHGAKTIWYRAAFLGQLKKAGVGVCGLLLDDLMCDVQPAESEIGVQKLHDLWVFVSQKIEMVRDFYN